MVPDALSTKETDEDTCLKSRGERECGDTLLSQPRKPIKRKIEINNSRTFIEIMERKSSTVGISMELVSTRSIQKATNVQTK